MLCEKIACSIAILLQKVVTVFQIPHAKLAWL